MGWLVGLPLGLFRPLGSILLVALRFAVPIRGGDLGGAACAEAVRPVPGGGRGQAGAEISRPCVYGGL